MAVVKITGKAKVQDIHFDNCGFEKQDDFLDVGEDVDLQGFKVTNSTFGERELLLSRLKRIDPALEQLTLEDINAACLAAKAYDPKSSDARRAFADTLAGRVSTGAVGGTLAQAIAALVGLG